jgi:two-component system sensor kinase FixL
MKDEPASAALAASPVLPVLAGVFAIAIFTLDTATPFDIAIAVLYVVVVLMAANFCQRRGVMLVAAGCLGLTLTSYLFQHQIAADTALVRFLMSASAIGATTFLALKNQAANTVLRERARLLDLTHDSVFVRDLNDVITYWNRGAEDLYGWRRDEAIGRTSHQLMQTVFPVPLSAIDAQVLRTGRWEGELVHSKRDGTRITVASRWSLQRDERGQPIATMETNNDITERIRANEALQQAQAELAHVMRVATLGELTASIAHEVNQPLAAIVTNGEAGLRWLDRDPPELGEVRGAVQSMISDGVRASEVVWGLRAMSKKATSQRTRLDLNEVVEQVILLVQRELLTNRVVLRLELASGLPPVLADRVQLQQVIMNLAVNGIQAMSGTGDRPRELLVASRRHENNQVLVEVQDSGDGIPPENMNQLFNAFFTTKPNGMGMGLSISRSIIEAHGGRIWAARGNGRGATFQLSLPSADNAGDGP